MDKQAARDRAFYSSSLALLQLEFLHKKIGDKPNVKNLIRMVKHWRLTHLLVRHILCMILDCVM